MHPVVTGVLAAMAVIAVFVAGAMIEFDRADTPVNVEIGEQGPLERAGEALDGAVSAAGD